VSDSNLELPPLDGDVEALLRIERDRPSVSGAPVERMWSAIALELGAAAIPGAAEASPVGGAASPAQSAVGSGIGKLVLLKALPWMAVSLAVGSIGGFVAGHRVAGSRARVTPVVKQRETAERAGPAAVPELAPLASPVVSLGESPRPATTAPSVLGPAAPSPHGRRNPRARSDDGLAEEEALLRQAESALRAGNWSTALAEIDAYDRRFPKGELAEEAAYLGVRACRRGGDAASAHARLLDFRRRFPGSPLGKSSGD